MTLSNKDENSETISDPINASATSWDILYCPHIWNDSRLRDALLTPSVDSKMIKYCHTCRGKIRKYEIRDSFLPHIHSTPNGKNISIPIESNQSQDARGAPSQFSLGSSHRTRDNIALEDMDNNNRCIPTISRDVDSSIRHKFTSFETQPNNENRGRLRKSLKGIGCVVSLALSDASIKKRTQIQACSITIMIVAIIVISFVLVNFTSPNYKKNVVSTKAVPTKISDSSETSSAITSLQPISPQLADISTRVDFSSTRDYATTRPVDSTDVPDFIAKIQKNIKTFMKDVKKNGSNIFEEKPKDIINRDLSVKFCSCQKDEVCMLDENSGTAICKKAQDANDPTGCGGLCALDTEACQVVDRARGVRVCRQLTLVVCAHDEWRCRNGLCVHAKQRCDGEINCYDRSDEMHCDCDLNKEFRCGQSISCFPNSKLCNGKIDCWDGYDEVNCTIGCPKEQFTCTSGQCIQQSLFCDGFPDCDDSTDEPSGCDVACAKHEMRCVNNRCVALTTRCDGIDHCGDQTDEQNCS